MSCAGLVGMEQSEEGYYYYSVSCAGLVFMEQGEDGNYSVVLGWYETGWVEIETGVVLG